MKINDQRHATCKTMKLCPQWHPTPLPHALYMSLSLHTVTSNVFKSEQSLPCWTFAPGVTLIIRNITHQVTSPYVGIDQRISWTSCNLHWKSKHNNVTTRAEQYFCGMLMIGESAYFINYRPLVNVNRIWQNRVSSSVLIISRY